MATPQWVQDLMDRRDAITTELKNIDNNTTRAKPGAKPNTSGEGGGVQGVEYKRELLAELSAINEELLRSGQVTEAEAAAGESLFIIETHLN